MFERTIKLIGEANFKNLQDSQILIVGLGGVGEVCLETLARSGIKNIIGIDNDDFSDSNLNRQIISNQENVGKSKVMECQIYLNKINKNINFIPLNIFLSRDNIGLLDKYEIDYIIDACDTISTKIELIKYAHKKNIKIISSMGTGKKLDPTKLYITKISKTYNDPLAKQIRKKLREENINYDIPVISSKEEVRIKGKELASMMLVPAGAGLYLAYYIINDLLNKKE